MTAIFSYFLIRVPVSKIDVIILIISFIGVAILITRTVQEPSFVETSSPETAAVPN